jgi:serine-type D-Ala-D-Ala carboxypeptidase/endopeptidase (penicillin-binding protein 4)
VIWRANTFSQNLFAECLLKSLSAYEPDGRRAPRAGSFAEGSLELCRVLAGMGVDLTTSRVVDGSGLSHENRVTADAIAAALLAMDRRPARDDYLASLARPGQDGTVRRSYDDPVFRDRLWAKTGTIDGVHSLAGYAQLNGGPRVAFVFLINGSGSADLPRRLCRAMLGP